MENAHVFTCCRCTQSDRKRQACCLIGSSSAGNKDRQHVLIQRDIICRELHCAGGGANADEQDVPSTGPWLPSPGTALRNQGCCQGLSCSTFLGRDQQKLRFIWQFEKQTFPCGQMIGSLSCLKQTLKSVGSQDLLEVFTCRLLLPELAYSSCLFACWSTSQCSSKLLRTTQHIDILIAGALHLALPSSCTVCSLSFIHCRAPSSQTQPCKSWYKMCQSLVLQC